MTAGAEDWPVEPPELMIREFCERFAVTGEAARRHYFGLRLRLVTHAIAAGCGMNIGDGMQAPRQP